MQEHLLTGAKSTRINFTDMSFAQQLMKKLNWPLYKFAMHWGIIYLIINHVF